MSLRHIIRGPAKRRFHEFDCFDWGRQRIRSITERERSTWDTTVFDARGKFSKDHAKYLKCRLIVLCHVDDQGNPDLADTDVEHLMDQDSMYIDKMASECQQHCGITEADLEELAKNFGRITEGDSPSSSPEQSDGST